MRSREANRMFLMIVLLDLTVQILVSFWFLISDSTLDLVTADVITELVLLIPAFVFLFIGKRQSGLSIPEQTGIRRVRPLPVFLSLVYLLLLSPITTLANMISMLFTENTVDNMSEEILKLPVWASILMIGVAGPIVEEFVFRGASLHAYRRDRPRGYAPVILSSLVFALIHMNLNQAVYAMIIGIGFGLLCEATGSLLYPMLCHMAFNSVETVMLYMTKDMEKFDRTGAAYFDELKESIAVMLIVSLICTPLAICVLNCIRKVCAGDREIAARRSMSPSGPAFPAFGNPPPGSQNPYANAPVHPAVNPPPGSQNPYANAPGYPAVNPRPGSQNLYANAPGYPPNGPMAGGFGP
ncbi:MAG: CPBP family intramembrane metalloprotease, partial [Lachnospiraceae bacterium]|nr:CPBP family intramembrane metalloprotease [Lachnospiraceae bacterium]